MSSFKFANRINTLHTKKNQDKISHTPINKLPWADNFMTTDKRYTGISGGRGGGAKTSNGASIVVDSSLDPKYAGTRMLCLREYGVSVKESTFSVVKDTIYANNLQHLFNIVPSYGLIKAKPTDVTLIFGGCQNPEALKSGNNVSLIWIDEAEKIQRYALDVICPIARSNKYDPNKYSPKILFTYNPRNPIDAVKKYLNDKGKFAHQEHFTIFDTPSEWQDPILLQDAEIDRVYSPDIFKWLWLGEPDPNSPALIFENIHIEDSDKYSVRASKAWIDPSYIGGDTTALTLFIWGAGVVYCLGFAWRLGWKDCLQDILNICNRYNVVEIGYESNNLDTLIKDIINLQYKHKFKISYAMSKKPKIERITRITPYLSKFVFLKIKEGGLGYVENWSYIRQLQDYTILKTKYPKDNDFDDAPDSLTTGAKYYKII